LLLAGLLLPFGPLLAAGCCSTEIGSWTTLTLSPGRLRERHCNMLHAVVAMADCSRQVPTFIFDLEFIKSAVRMPSLPSLHLGHGACFLHGVHGFV